ncbi:hypothetical protein BD626DRAFT_417141 [Schizophyllum amplum]|uniref:Uncharacterized protein n=1 Tax=Schizophyllum amplum TaxID=97359 RepID=A0A550BSH4_9AGAR|nr:hypothetical protein BD626DRAFT_417141 [Auriculariopsis ampla]
MSTASSITVVAEDAPAQATNATIDRPDAQSQRVKPAAGRFKRRRMSTNCECKPSIGYKQRASGKCSFLHPPPRNQTSNSSSTAAMQSVIAQPAPVKTAPVQAQPQAALEMTLRPANKSSRSKNARTTAMAPRAFAEAARAKYALLLRSVAAAKGICDCVADIICCPCEMCC